MAFDCYCALCGIGFSGLRIGSPSDATAERRRQYVQSVSRSLNESKDRPALPQDGEESINSYDPRLVNRESIAWTSQVHCLGVHEVKGKNKAFVSGPGYYADAGELAVKVGQRASRTYFNCYGFGTDETPGPVVPFHWCCFEILLQSLTGSTDIKNVDLDVLYQVMMDLVNGSGAALRLDYGDDVATAQGQYWQCLPGTEYTVAHPTSTPDLSSFITTQLKDNANLHTLPKDFDLGTRNPVNPFKELPAELVYQICSGLPGESLKSLTNASLFIHLLTRDDHFWRRFIESDMPWLWEAKVLREERETTGELNHERVYAWLDTVTKPGYGLDDSQTMGVANRRRIWNACQGVVTAYRTACA
ncbi:hypothetical protein BDV18DRAFT_23555 [Aspergillus unguis]